MNNLKSTLTILAIFLLAYSAKSQVNCVIDPGIKAADQWVYFDVDGNVGTAEFAILSTQFSTKLFIVSALAQIYTEGGEIVSVKPGREFDGSETYGGGGEHILKEGIWHLAYRIYDGRLGFMQLSVDPIGIVLDRYGTNATPHQPIIVDDCRGNGPINRINMSATPNNQGINLSWVTQEEGDIEGYELQRSSDGRHFQTLDWISSQGRTASEKRYTYADLQVVEDMTYYYRLKQIDNKGQIALSNAVSGELSAAKSSHISPFYPNPVFGAHTQLQVLSEQMTEVLVLVYDGLGREMKRMTTRLHAGANTLELNVADLPSGHYYTLIREDNRVYKRRFYVSR